jgi:hypothetical protein
MGPAVKSSQVNLRLSPALKAEAERAAARDHRSLTSLIEKLLADHLRNRVTLEAWHDQSQARFDELLLKRAPAMLSPRKYRELSFVIHTADGQELKPQDLLQIVQANPNGMRGTFSCSSLFHVDTRNETAPYYTCDAASTRSGDLGEILESVVFPDDLNLNIVDFWRITPRGFATHIRTHNEDREDMRNAGREPGKWFWPFYLVRNLYELALHAYLLSEHFDKSETVEFRCEWWGLHDREIADARPMIHWMPGKIAKMDHCVTSGEWAKEDLRRTADVVSALAGPVLRLFDPSFDCSPDWVGAQTQHFKETV